MSNLVRVSQELSINPLKIFCLLLKAILYLVVILSPGLIIITSPFQATTAIWNFIVVTTLQHPYWKALIRQIACLLVVFPFNSLLTIIMHLYQLATVMQPLFIGLVPKLAVFKLVEQVQVAFLIQIRKFSFILILISF